MRKTIAFLIFFQILTSCSYASPPKLYNLTCDEYWDYHKAHSNEEAKKEYFQELVTLWNYSVDKFQREYPNLQHPTLSSVPDMEEWKDPPFFIMNIYMACAKREGNGSKILGENLQINFLKLAQKKEREDNAFKSDCSISNGTQAKLFFPTMDGVLTGCIEKGYNNRKIIYNETKKAIAIEVCTKKGHNEMCKTINPTMENICLSTYGECTRNSDGECGWIHTEESKKCVTRN